MKITRCRTDHIENPLGYTLNRPVLSWCTEDSEGTGAISTRIAVSKESDCSSPLLDTGERNDISPLGFPLDLKLEPYTRYYWQVSVTDDAGAKIDSEIQWFETALLEEPWQASWISCSSEEIRHPIFEKRLNLKGSVKQARLYLSGLGVYEASINGARIGSEYLAPGCTNYASWIQYQTYDITDQIKDGSMLSILLGHGWYSGRFGFTRSDKPHYGDAWQLIAEVRIVYANGTSEIIGTDSSWQVRRSKVTFSNIYDGEKRDDTLPDLPIEQALNTPGPDGTLTARYSVPVQVFKELPVKRIETADNDTVLDIGQNIAGTFRLRIHEPKDTRIRIQFSETLQDQHFYRDNLRTALAEYDYVSDGTETVIEPRLTFYGGRYVKVEGINHLNESDFTALALSSSMKETGSLAVGNAKVQQLISNAEWSRIDNFIDVPTDCPQRDERMGWTGDAQVFSETACWMSDAYAFYRKYLHDLYSEQKMRGGMVPDVVPAFDMNATSSVWGDAAVIIPWNVYQFYGDTSILSEQFDSMKTWVDYITAKDGTDFGWRREFHFGDWLALDLAGADPGNCAGATDVDFIADVYYMNSAELTGKAAEVLQKPEDQKHYKTLAEQLRERIEQEYYSPNGRCCAETQTGLLLSLKHHLGNAEKIRGMLRKKFKESKGKLQTGFVGTPLLCSVLSENGMQDIAEQLLLNESYPGWLYEVNLGATTIWERWNSLDENGHISSTGMNSLNHYSYGSIVGWMYEHLAGLRPLSAGFQSVHMEPAPVYALKHLDCSFKSASGTWKISWNIVDEQTLHLAVTVPFGCEAEVRLPLADDAAVAEAAETAHADIKDGMLSLKAGSYEWEYRTVKPMHVCLSTNSSVEELLSHPSARTLLLKVMPQIAQLPPRMQKAPMRVLAEQMGGAAMASQMNKLDQMLKNLE
ncbi:MAG: glycoside hydrolase family 78 protein [Solobacterium sp.]|jgi:alpha-L-rhamnosidase|nr:glycoside hydrolase family 78 protein [Solobacterium sp.]MCH4222497.1 glycoside hydrolase family 78 protein [Solobacterium sp.]MCH4265452.1 glycoside hydrolase family 78 protein [Solobacterium sp.]